MELWYYIKTEYGWKRTDYETYVAYKGEKERLPSTWGVILLQRYLKPYRYLK